MIMTTYMYITLEMLLNTEDAEQYDWSEHHCISLIYY